MAFNNAFPAGGGAGPNYFANGGLVSREIAPQGLNTDELAAKLPWQTAHCLRRWWPYRISLHRATAMCVCAMALILSKKSPRSAGAIVLRRQPYLLASGMAVMQLATSISFCPNLKGITLSSILIPSILLLLISCSSLSSNIIENSYL